VAGGRLSFPQYFCGIFVIAQGSEFSVAQDAALVHSTNLISATSCGFSQV